MTKQVFSMIVGGALLVLAGNAYAGQPMSLSDGQMDGVTAGFTAISVTLNTAIGELGADTTSMTLTNVLPTAAEATATGISVAAGGVFFQVYASSLSQSAVTIP